jgi:hypothetical protein
MGGDICWVNAETINEVEAKDFNKGKLEVCSHKQKLF